ncbi:MAG: hypothetical protein IJV35_08930 [Neisseriaceae bacterium]|nr:hypothetical protein [Neisseriaceae bacterium]
MTWCVGLCPTFSGCLKTVASLRDFFDRKNRGNLPSSENGFYKTFSGNLKPTVTPKNHIFPTKNVKNCHFFVGKM